MKYLPIRQSYWQVNSDVYQNEMHIKEQNKERDISAALNFFRWREGSARECAEATHIVINSMTWNIYRLRAAGWIVPTRKAIDKQTGRSVQYYTLIGDPIFDPNYKKGGTR